MTTLPVSDVKRTVRQICGLKDAGAELVRVAVPDIKSALFIKDIKKSVDIPVIADIHFDYRIAVEAIKNGADKIRINPGNIGGADRVKIIIESARKRNVPIRIGVNSGSLKALKEGDSFFALDSKMRAQAMVRELLEYIKIFERENYTNLVLSLKSSDVLTSILSYRMISNLRDYPLHLGITEAGDMVGGTVRSAIGIGTLLSEGIGDTIRISLSADPVEEIKVGKEILKSLNLRKLGPVMISCPTCGRCQVNIIDMVSKTGRLIEELTAKNAGLRKTNIKVAVMGCVVNGPGEARDADIGFAGGKNWGMLFKRGKKIKRIRPASWTRELKKELVKKA